ncbi:pentapeptide repeat-containing protein [Amycolatopsis cynarae]|uniref:Pentapeptide repeat-containing protein n=1 Tax=Amycolatopsis cynarae TaxID=2995223 RepID=A0ABY7B6W2_9PSEU|nr:pentapeptide repeat-containing protein [Amycolatopsis sp. HUAS 11-8]WAL67679.1 pentapeptide repeat-containing protein [Amycolatopsis sp. HUAS 11-8]
MAATPPVPPEQPTTGRNQKVLSNKTIAISAAILIVFAVLMAWLLLRMYGNGSPANQARLEGIRTVGTIVLGAGGAVALLLTARRQQTAEHDLATKRFDLLLREQANEDIRHDAAERRITELYLKSVEQLGSEKAPVRLAGLYALDRLAQDNPRQRQTIVNVISAYLRMPYALPSPPSPADHDSRDEYKHELEELEVRLTAQNILTDHLTPTGDPERFWRDIDLNLNSATLIDFSLRECEIRRSNFSKSTFTGETMFLGVDFTSEARFQGATFKGQAWFNNANFAGDVRFNSVTFEEDARFEKSTFIGAVTFRDSIFLGKARFDQSSFTGVAVFTGANFSSSTNFSQASFVNDAWLPSAQFGQDTHFSGTIFSGDAWFHGAAFNGYATFEKAAFTGDIRFDGATLDGMPYEPPELNPRDLDYFEE